VNDIRAAADASRVAHRFREPIKKMRRDNRIGVDESQNIAAR
jgi:hypothetical protein